MVRVRLLASFGFAVSLPPGRATTATDQSVHPIPIQGPRCRTPLAEQSQVAQAADDDQGSPWDRTSGVRSVFVSAGAQGRKLMRRNASGAFMARTGCTTGASVATSGVASARARGRALLRRCGSPRRATARKAALIHRWTGVAATRGTHRREGHRLAFSQEGECGKRTQLTRDLAS